MYATRPLRTAAAYAADLVARRLAVRGEMVPGPLEVRLDDPRQHRRAAAPASRARRCSYITWSVGGTSAPISLPKRM